MISKKIMLWIDLIIFIKRRYEWRTVECVAGMLVSGNSAHKRGAFEVDERTP